MSRYPTLDRISSRDKTLAAAEHQVEVVKGLIDMRKAGLLKAVHAEGGLLSIELPSDTPRLLGEGVKHRIAWATAERMVAEFRERERSNPGAQSRRKPPGKTPLKSAARAGYFR